MQFSIIIPIYKVERYIRESVESVLQQCCGDFELILVDDGSPDGCPAICDEYSHSDARVRVIHKENGGISTARNTGIKSAQGKYLIYLDGDDRLAPDVLKLLEQQITDSATQPDVIIARYAKFTGEEFSVQECNYILKSLEGLNSDQVLGYLFGEIVDFDWSSCKQTYRREFIIENSLYFDELLSSNEDGNWLLEVLLKAKRFQSFNELLFYYRIDNPNSSIHKKTDLPKYTSGYAMYVRWFSYFDQQYPKGSTRDYMLARLSRGYINCAKGINNIKGDDRQKAIKMFSTHLEMLSYSKVRAHKLLEPFTRIFGLEAYIWLLRKGHQLKELLNRLLRRG